MKLIVGLGNKGKKYENTRHNVGFMVIDEIVKCVDADPFKDKMNGDYSIFTHHNEKVILLKPSSFMNLSGEVVQAYLNYFNINKTDMIIIHDDMDIELGNFKIRQQGSSAGHNGLKNIELHLGTNEYNRIKVGISRDKETNSANYVLGEFREDEKNKVEEVVRNVANAAIDFIEHEIVYVMNKYNGQ